MGTFITQGNYTNAAMRGMVDNPEDRSAPVAALIESVGAKLIQHYVTTGEFDFLVIAEGDNVIDLVAALMVAGSAGGVTNLRTIQALSTAEAMAAMEKANAVRAGIQSAGSTG